MSLRTKLVSAFAVITAIAAVIAVLDILAQQRIAAKFNSEEQISNLDALCRGSEIKFKTQVQEWKNILLRGGDLPSREKYTAAFVAAGGEVKTGLGQLKAAMTEIGEKADAVDAVLSEHEKLVSAYTKALESFDNSNPAGGLVIDKAVHGIDRPLAATLEKLSAEVARITAEHNKASKDSIASEMSHARQISIAAVIIGISIAAALSYYLSTSISRALNQISATLRDGSDQVSSAASQVSAASQQLAEGSSEQAAGLEETGASLEEMASMTGRNAENAQRAKEIANQARIAADAGAEDMKRMDAAMIEIKSASDNIAKIIKTIDEIAFQTNILALNAAVEAARAGEAGMGFAVVADEVRSLAQRSARAARDTADKIEDCINKSDAGVKISGMVGANLNEILAKAREVDEIVAEIANASREQKQGIDQVNTALTQMDKVTQNNAATAEESAAAAEELNAQADTLKDVVASLEALIKGGVAVRDVQAPAAPASGRREPAIPALRAMESRSDVRIKSAKTTSHAHVSGSEDVLPFNEPEIAAQANSAGDGFKDF